MLKGRRARLVAFVLGALTFAGGVLEGPTIARRIESVVLDAIGEQDPRVRAALEALASRESVPRRCRFIARYCLEELAAPSFPPAPAGTLATPCEASGTRSNVLRRFEVACGSFTDTWIWGVSLEGKTVRVAPLDRDDRRIDIWPYPDSDFLASDQVKKAVENSPFRARIRDPRRALRVLAEMQDCVVRESPTGELTFEPRSGAR